MKRANIRFLLNDPSEPLRFRVTPEGEDYTVYELDWNNLVSALEDVEGWAAKQIRRPRGR